MTRKEQVFRAIHMQGPEYVPLLYSKTMDDTDIVIIPVEMHFTGPDKDLSEWGFQWDYIDHNLTLGQPKESIIKTWDDLKNYKAPNAFDQTRFDAIKEAKKRFGDDRYYMANFILTGFTIMTMLRGFNNLLEDMYLNREAVEKLADIVFCVEEDIIRQLKQNGFDVIALGDDFGTQDNLIMDPQIWREIIKPRLKKQIDLSHECGLDISLHSCGYIYDIIPDLIELGFDMLNPGQPNINGIERMGKNFGGKICFACPISYQSTGVTGTKEDIFREIKKYVDYLGSYNGGLIGIIIEDLTDLGGDPNNIQYTIDAYKTYGKYK